MFNDSETKREHITQKSECDREKQTKMKHIIRRERQREKEREM